MSRIGNKIIPIPEGVTVTVKDNVCNVKGPKGEQNVKFSSVINVEVKDGHIHVTRANDLKATKQEHGTVRALINNATIGTSKEFVKKLHVIGIGYKAEIKGKDVVISAGYSHTVTVSPLPGVTIKVNDLKRKDIICEIEVSGSDKFAVGQTAALIREVRKPEPYQGKGIRYADEHVLRKEGKRAGKK